MFLNLQYLQQNDITAICFDLDDTLVSTSELIKGGLTSIYSYLNTKYGYDIDYIAQQFSSIALIQRKYDGSVGLDDCWDERFSIFAETLNLPNSEIDVILKMMHKTYFSEEIKLKSGVSELMSKIKDFKENGIQVYLVTHGAVDWTEHKLKRTGLNDIFKMGENIFCVDTKVSKNVEEWRKALESFNLDFKNVLVIGDDYQKDIKPTRDVGVKHHVLVNDGKGWKATEDGAHEAEGLTKVATLNELMEIYYAIESR